MSTFEDSEPRAWNCELIIQSSEVSTTQANFPLLLTEDCLPLGIFGASGAQAGGGDIRFSSDADGVNQLACDVISFDQVNDTCEIMVNVPSVSSSANTSIWIWWNTAVSSSQPSASSTYGQYNTYDSKFLQWLPDKASGDRTSKQTSWSDQGTPTDVAGKIGDAIEFQSTDGMSAADDNDISGNITIMAWLKLSGTSGFRSLFANGRWNDGFAVGTNIARPIFYNNGTSFLFYNGVTPISSGTWTHLTVSAETGAGGSRAWFNDDEANALGGTTLVDLGTAGMFLGHNGHGVGYSPLKGDVDTFVAVDDTADVYTDLSQTLYKNQNDPSAFVIEQTAQETTTEVVYDADSVAAEFSAQQPVTEITAASIAVSSAISEASNSTTVLNYAGGAVSSQLLVVSAHADLMVAAGAVDSTYSVVSPTTTISQTYNASFVSSSFSITAPALSISCDVSSLPINGSVVASSSQVNLATVPVAATFSTVSVESVALTTQANSIQVAVGLLAPATDLTLQAGNATDTTLDVVTPSVSISALPAVVVSGFSIAATSTVIVSTGDIVTATFSVTEGVPGKLVQYYVNASEVYSASAYAQEIYIAGAHAQKVVGGNQST